MTERVSPELEARMIALVRNIRNSGSLYYATEVVPLYNEACRIVANLPRPVDPDMIEARKIVASQAPFGAIDPSWNSRVIDGFEDDGPWVKNALAAIKRGRELAAA